MKQRPWGSTAYWLVLRSLLSQLSSTIQDYLSMGSTNHRKLAPCALVLNSLMETFPQLIFSIDSLSYARQLARVKVTKISSSICTNSRVYNKHGSWLSIHLLWPNTDCDTFKECSYALRYLWTVWGSLGYPTHCFQLMKESHMHCLESGSWWARKGIFYIRRLTTMTSGQLGFMEVIQ